MREIGLKVNELIIKYNMEVVELFSEVYGSLAGCKNRKDYEKLKSQIECIEFCRSRILYDVIPKRQTQQDTLMNNTEWFFELDFDKEKVYIYNYGKLYADFKFKDTIWVCYDVYEGEPRFLVANKPNIIVEQDNFVVIKYGALYLLVKDRTEIIKKSKDKNVLTKAVLERLRNGQ